uniref:Uncharacterized protein n=1 Tax=Strongyloides venezuelensis TaxID=75913 RepID=A0A0K0EUD6_STRVS
MVRVPFNFSFRKNKKKEKNSDGGKCIMEGKDMNKIVFPSERRKMNHMTPADFREKLDDDMEKSMKNCQMNHFLNDEQIFVHGVLILPEMNNTGTLMYAAKLKKFYNQEVFNNDDIEEALEKLEKTKDMFEERSKTSENKGNYIHQSNTSSGKISKDIFNSFPSQKYKQ